MYSIIYRPAVKKDLRRLDKSALSALHDTHLPLLKENPHIGERLKGAYRLYYRYKFTQQGVSYRIVYDIKFAELVIILILIGHRENFYKELKRRVKVRRPALASALFLAVLVASLALASGVARGQESKPAEKGSGAGATKGTDSERTQIDEIREQRFGLNAVAELLGLTTCKITNVNVPAPVKKCYAPDLREVILKLIQVALGFTSLLVLIFVLYGGFTWTTAAGNSERVDKGRKILIWAGAGLVAVLLAWSVVTYILYTASRVVA